MPAVPSERGLISFKAILGVLVFAAIIFAGFRVLPPYIDNYQLQGSMDNLARTATYSKMTDADVQKEVMALANDLGIRLEPNEILISRRSYGIDIHVQYDVVVDLMVRQVDLHFAPSAGNSNITAR